MTNDDTAPVDPSTDKSTARYHVNRVARETGWAVAEADHPDPDVTAYVRGDWRVSVRWTETGLISKACLFRDENLVEETYWTRKRGMVLGWLRQEKETDET